MDADARSMSPQVINQHRNVHPSHGGSRGSNPLAPHRKTPVTTGFQPSGVSPVAHREASLNSARRPGSMADVSGALHSSFGDIPDPQPDEGEKHPNQYRHPGHTECHHGGE